MASLSSIGAIALAAFTANGVTAAPVNTTIAVAETLAPRVPPALSQSGTAALKQGQPAAPDCPTARVDLVPLPAGRTQILIQSDCRKSELVHISYASAEFIRRIDDGGRLTFVLDCFAGDRPDVALRFADGTEERKRVVASDLDRVTKVAVVWTAPVNLDLHAFEYSARAESSDHVWAGTPLSRDEALGKVAKTRKGHGFLSSTSDGTDTGAKLEVYTFFHSAGEARGVISMALDYESRARTQRSPDTCGTGLYAELEYEAILLERLKEPVTLFRRFSSVECNMTLSGTDRLNHKAVPEIVIKK